MAGRAAQPAATLPYYAASRHAASHAARRLRRFSAHAALLAATVGMFAYLRRALFEGAGINQY